MSAQFKGCLDCDTLPITLQLLSGRVIEEIWRQLELSD